MKREADVHIESQLATVTKTQIYSFDLLWIHNFFTKPRLQQIKLYNKSGTNRTTEFELNHGQRFTWKMAIQARPMLSKEMDPWKGLLEPGRHSV